MNQFIIGDTAFQSDSLSWALKKAGRRFGEWLEYQSYQFRWTEPSESEESIIWPDWLLNLRSVLFWLIVAGLVIWAGWMLYRILYPYAREARSRRHSFRGMESSPSYDQKTPNQWLQLAQELRQQQRYAEACRALYLGMLQQLQDKKIVPRQDSATDGDYRQWVKPIAKAKAYTMLIETHEQTVFGKAAVSEQLVDRCQQAYREILDP